MPNRIDRVFKTLKSQGRKALIGYITAGFPSKSSLARLIPLLEGSGLDILEVGVPFSDPIADGPTIQAASQKALANGVTLSWILSSLRTLRRRGVKLPIVLMTYCNPVSSMGIERFFSAAKRAGVDGLIFPDLIPEEAGRFDRAARTTGIHIIYLIAPNTPLVRVRRIAARTRGFLYAVSMTGVTGVSQALPSDLSSFLRSVMKVSPKPVAVGFGISRPEQARAIAALADGVIVGSALIRAIEASSQTAYKGAAGFVRRLRQALDHHTKETSHAA